MTLSAVRSGGDGCRRNWTHQANLVPALLGETCQQTITFFACMGATRPPSEVSGQLCWSSSPAGFSRNVGGGREPLEGGSRGLQQGSSQPSLSAVEVVFISIRSPTSFHATGETRPRQSRRCTNASWCHGQCRPLCFPVPPTLMSHPLASRLPRCLPFHGVLPPLTLSYDDPRTSRFVRPKIEDSTALLSEGLRIRNVSGGIPTGRCNGNPFRPSLPAVQRKHRPTVCVLSPLGPGRSSLCVHGQGNP
jgi:hypothetical protein